MVFTYDELNEQKESGVKFSWKNISEEQLRKLYIDNKIPSILISRLYGIKQSQVDYKRKKFGIKFMEIIANDFIENVPKVTNDSMKTVFFDNFNIDKFSKIITHYAFRNGPIEDIHSNGQLSEKDMMVLNKYMVNRIAGILQLIKDEQWFKLVGLMNLYGIYGADWDKAEPDTKELDTCLKHLAGKIRTL